MLGAIVYVIGACTSAACATLLMRGYIRGTKEASSMEWTLFCWIGDLQSANFRRFGSDSEC